MSFVLRWAWFACALLVGCAPAPVENIDFASATSVRGQFDPGQHFDWAGCYESPQSGVLELRQKGNQVSGSYRLLNADVYLRGTLSGSVRGNLAQVVWKEQQTASEASEGSKRVSNYASEGQFYALPDPRGGDSWRLVGEQFYYVGSHPGKEYRHRNVWTATRVGCSPTSISH